MINILDDKETKIKGILVLSNGLSPCFKMKTGDFISDWWEYLEDGKENGSGKASLSKLSNFPDFKTSCLDLEQCWNRIANTAKQILQHLALLRVPF